MTVSPTGKTPFLNRCKKSKYWMGKENPEEYLPLLFVYVKWLGRHWITRKRAR
jgi:hypothetical protein